MNTKSNRPGIVDKYFLVSSEVCTLRLSNTRRILSLLWIFIIKYLEKFNIVLTIMGLADQRDHLPVLKVNTSKQRQRTKTTVFIIFADRPMVFIRQQIFGISLRTSSARIAFRINCLSPLNHSNYLNAAPHNSTKNEGLGSIYKIFFRSMIHCPGSLWVKNALK